MIRELLASWRPVGDRVWGWTREGLNKQLRVRLSYTAWRQPAAVFYFRGRDARNCYCLGHSTEFRLAFCRFTLSVWYAMDRVRYPCPCERVIWAMSPSDYAPEIEDYGYDRLVDEHGELMMDRILGKSP